MPPGEPHLEYLDNKWNDSGIIAAGMLASAIFMAAGLGFTLVALLKRHRTGAMADPLLHPEYSLIKEEDTM